MKPRVGNPVDHARIDAALKSLIVPINSLKLWPANYRQGDIGAISESLKRFGQKKPVVVQTGSRIVVAGNHLLKAARALRWQRIAAAFSEMTDEEAVSFAVADNRTSDLATNEDQALVDVLALLSKREGGLTGTGYDGDDLDRLLAKLADDGAGGSSDENELGTTHTCPKCGHRWTD